MLATLSLTGKHGKNKKTLLDKEDYLRYKNYKWHLTHYGYAASKGCHWGKRGLMYLHRLIINAQKGELVDHVNRNRLDNRKENLRIVDWSTSAQNKTKYRGTSKYWGVYWNKQTKCWRTRIMKNKKIIEGGLFKDETEAAKKYDKLAVLIYGNKARINFNGGTHYFSE